MSTRPQLSLLAWVAAIAGSLFVLHSPVAQGLSLPPLDTDGWSAWLRSTDPVISAFALLRAAAIAALWYLAAATALSLVAHTARRASLTTAADALTVPFVRRLTQRALGIAVAGTLALPAGTTAYAAPPQRSDDVPVLRHLRPDEPLPSFDTTQAPAEIPAAAEPPSPPVAGEWTVRPGDSFWTIAEQTLGDAGHAVTDESLGTYWRALVEANRSVLVDSDNPDLIFPGQVVSLPPVVGGIGLAT